MTGTADLDGQVREAREHHGAGRYAEAELIYRQILDRRPDDAEVMSRLGAALAAQGRLDEMLSTLQRAVEIDPGLVEAHNNLGAGFRLQGRLDDAVAASRRALAINPDHVSAHVNLGAALQGLGRIDDAVASYRKAITLKPDLAAPHVNLGIALQGLGRIDDAVASYRQALAIAPGLADAHLNLGAALRQMGRLDDAVASYLKALAIDPNLASAHANLGTALRHLGRLEDAVASYHRALAIQPDFAEAWNNLKGITKVLLAAEADGHRRDGLRRDGFSPAARATPDFHLFEYYLDSFKPHQADESFARAMAALPPRADEAVTVDGGAADAQGAPRLFGDPVILLPFGRSGTGLLHSLIDGHPEISTLPSIYLRGFFNAGVWDRIAGGGWRTLPERFADEFAVLFDATSPRPVPSRLGEVGTDMGKVEGMTTLGENRDEALSLDREKFCSEVLRIMKGFGTIDPGTFLLIVHEAYERILGSRAGKHVVFYHIHNPDDYAKLNFLRYAPSSRLVIMVREPIQSCESWVRLAYENGDYDQVIHNVITMLFDFDQVAYRTQDSVGVRLEDLKARPEATLHSLCAWMGVADAPSLYQATAQGKKWWGDPTSPDYDEDKGMSPFTKAPINRPVGAIFSAKDQFVLRTLYYPFSVRFGYREADAAGFARDLAEVRPLLDDTLDFEKAVAENSGINAAELKRRATYRLLRASLVDRWDVLDEFKDYPHMLTPLEIIKE